MHCVASTTPSVRVHSPPAWVQWMSTVERSGTGISISISTHAIVGHVLIFTSEGGEVVSGLASAIVPR